jgi:anti-anti-sigma factor
VANGTAFTIEQVDAGPPIRFRCSGDLDLAGAPAVAEAVGAVDAHDVVLDVGEVAFLDSSGVGALIAQQTRLRAAGHRLRLVGLQAMPRRSLETLGLLDELT